MNARLANMNWTAVQERFAQIDEDHTRMAAQIVAFENRLTGAVSQLQGLMQEVQVLKSQRIGTGPSQIK